jgi:hypothetical protein
MSETLTERPKPKPFVPQKSAPSTPSSDTKVESEQPVVKKRDDETMQEYSDRLDAMRPKRQPFVPKPHLTDRPFKNEALQALRDSMQPKPTRKRK